VLWPVCIGRGLEYTISRIIFGLFGDPFAGRTFADCPRPSLTAVAFGLVGVPAGAGIVEELVYRGYALPRLIAFSNRWTGLILMAVGFGWQHVGLSLIVDWRSVAERGLALAVVGLVMGVIYLKQQRLVPLIIGHALWDFLGIGVFSSVLPLVVARG
jgi:membrane protease YdiL (CAAX protease family)